LLCTGDDDDFLLLLVSFSLLWERIQEDDHFPIPFPALPADRRTYEIHEDDPVGMGRSGPGSSGMMV
jgi:hypothetical protein